MPLSPKVMSLNHRLLNVSEPENWLTEAAVFVFLPQLLWFAFLSDIRPHVSTHEVTVERLESFPKLKTR